MRKPKKIVDNFDLSTFINPDFLSVNAQPAHRVAPYDPMQQMPHMIDTVDPLTAFSPENNVELPAMNVETDLAYMRAELPFLPIVKFPMLIATAALVPNVPFDLAVPDGVTLARFIGNTDYYVSHGGAAAIPTAGGEVTGSIYRPEFAMFYVGGIKSFSIASPNVGAVVSLIGYPTNNWPRSRT